MNKIAFTICLILLLNINYVEPHFPRDFMWGTATAAYQVEGAPDVDGKQPSIWDVFSHQPGKIHNNETGDIADDTYHRYQQDIELLKDLNVTHYRFSIAWTRVLTYSDS